jgi:ammonium transporter, Amt family
MQAGFTLVECGSVRKKNASSVLLKNIIDTLFGAVAFWFFGYAFAFGGSHKGFIGNKASFFFGSGFEEDEAEDEYLRFIFQFSFANTAATIVSGCLAERVHFYTYAGLSFFITGFVYPVIVHWIWNPNGWLKDMGVHDFAGSGVVHAVGGCAGLVACWIAGPRHGYNKKDEEK